MSTNFFLPSDTNPQDPFHIGFSHSFEVGNALTDNPHLLGNAQLASDVANSPDPHVTAPLLSHAAQMQATQKAAADLAAKNPEPHHWWDKVIHGASTGLESLMKPLKEVQRDYKFVHSVWSRHGVLQGTLVALGVVGGGVGGFFLGGPEGAILGAEAAATGLRKLGGEVNAQDSYADSENENYKVSIGRDVANALGAHGQTDKGQGWGSTFSGTVDGVFDVTADPLMVLGKIPKVVREGKYLVLGEEATKVPIAYRSAGVQQFFANNTLRLTTADNLDKLYSSAKSQTVGSLFAGSARRLNRAYEELARLSSSGEIAAKWPGLAGLSDELAKAVDSDAVHSVFLRTFKEKDLMERFAISGVPIIPSRTATAAALSKFADKLRQPGWGDLEDAAFNFNNAANFILPFKFTHVAKETVDAAGEIVRTVERKWIAPVVFNPFSKEKWATAVASKVRTFSGYQPASITKNLEAISSKGFDPADPSSFKDIYSVAYFGMGDKLAKRMTTNYISSGSFDEAGKFVPGPNTHSIWLSIQSEALNAMGYPNDPQFIAETLKKLAATSKGTIGGQIFGIGKSSGVRASMIETEAGTEHAALWSHHTNEWMHPNFRAFKKAARDLTVWGRTYGMLEGVGHTFMGTVWNKMALATGGFGIRVAVAELLPTFIRFGTMNTIKLNIAKAAADMRYSLLEGEDESILAHAMLAHAGGAVDYTSPTSIAEFLKRESANASGKKVRQAFYNVTDHLMSEQTLERAAKLAMFTKGHMATGATTAGHYGEDGFANKMAESLDLTDQMVRPGFSQDVKISKRLMKPSATHRTYSAYDHHFDVFWATNLQKASQNVAQRAIAKDMVEVLGAKETLSAAELDTIRQELTLREYARLKGHEFDPSAGNGLGAKAAEDVYASDRTAGIDRYSKQNLIEFAHARVDDMLNTLTGHDNTFHHEFAQMVADGIKPQMKDVMHIGIDSKPMNTFGPELKPFYGNIFDRVTGGMFDKVIDPIINHVSREPMFFQHYNKAMDFYDPLVAEGVIDTETGVRMAIQRATRSMIPQIHNVELKSQFSILSKTFLPFWFAQEQAMRRFKDLQLTNPQALRYYQIVHHALNDPGFVNTDEYGNRYVTLPLIGEMGNGLLAAVGLIPKFKTLKGLPINAEGNLSSTKTIFPEMGMPGVSPFVSVPLNWVGSHFPGLLNPVKKVLGPHAFQQGVMDSFLPSAPLKNMWKGLTASEQDSTVANSMMSAIAAAGVHGHFPAPDASAVEQQDFLDRIKNNTISLIMLKAAVGMISPLAPKITQSDLGLSAEYHAEVQKSDYATAWMNFTKKYGKNAIPPIISKNTPTVTGLNVPYTEIALKWMDDNEKLITGKQSVGAVFLIPQLTGKNADMQMMATELFRLHLKSRKTPQQFMEAMTVASGNYEFYAASDANDAELKRLAEANDYNGITEQQAHFKQWKEDFAGAHPVWNDHYVVDAAHKSQLAKTAYIQLKYLFENNLAPKGKQTNAVKSLMTDYTNYEAYKNNPGFYNLSDLKTSWDAYLDTTAKEKPELKSIITSVFKRLP